MRPVLFALVVFLPSVASIAATPPLPTITGVTTAGIYTTVTGTAKSSGGFAPKKLYVCVSATDPSGKMADCSASSPAALLDPDSGAPAATNYLVPNADDGSFTAVLKDKLKPGTDYVYLVVDWDMVPAGGHSQTSISANAFHVPSAFQARAPIFTAVAGLAISGASSADSQAVFHASAIFDVPLTGKQDWVSGTRWWLGGQLKIAGIAQPGALSTNLSDLSAVQSYLAQAVNATPDKIVQSIEASVDAAVTIHSWSNSIDSLDAGTPTSDVDNKTYGTVISLGLIANAGAITPLSAAQANPPVYVVNKSIFQQYGPSGTSGSQLPSSCDPTATTPTPCYVAFIPQDRDRFYRHFEGGARLKMYGRDFGDNEYRPAAIADLTVGRNEYVTGGKFGSAVLHFGGWVPVPKVDAVYIFGSMDLAIAANNSTAPLILVPATTAGLTYSSSSVNQIPVEQPNRDRYVIGIGIDLYHLLGKVSLTSKQQSTGGSQATSSGRQ